MAVGNATRASVPPVGLVLLSLALLPLALGGCLPQARPGSLAPTLGLRTVGGEQVAMQDGIPVPSFDYQPRPRVDLSGAWRMSRRPLDTDLSLTDRSSSLAAIEAEAGGRQLPGYDDSHWPAVTIPGVLNPPPDAADSSAWFRRRFALPADWTGRTITLKFGAVNYIADVWLNGTWLGYHEGGATPFALAVENVARPGAVNELAVRVDVPAWGSRNDIVPWGLADWWDYGGILQPVWLEATPALAAVRADVVPHLDGADISVVVQNRGPEPVHGTVELEILPAVVDASDLLDPDPRRLVPAFATPVVVRQLESGDLAPGDIGLLNASVAIQNSDTWSPASPALYVLHVTVHDPGGATDDLYETFGLRHIGVDPEAPRLLLNGQNITFAGVALHGERIEAASSPAVTGSPVITPAVALAQLQQARRLSATLVRTGHQPANPSLLMVADRLGIAIWEEIPLYHFTPLTFQLTMARGIPQQMLREVALRDMDHPAVLFYGLANESTGGQERTDALNHLYQIAREIDGTRLVGQAAYGFDPTDPTSAGLDVVGFTFYWGVFYGQDPTTGTRDALIAAHRAYPIKPIMILEFGRWADGANGPAEQARILRQTGRPLAAASTARQGGYVAAMVWWTLEDYLTMRPGIAVEHFGLFDETGSARPAAIDAAGLFGSIGTGPAEAQIPETISGGSGLLEREGSAGTARLLGFLAYGLGISVLVLAILLGISLVLGGRTQPGRRTR